MFIFDPCEAVFHSKKSDLCLRVKVYKMMYKHPLLHIFCSKDPSLYTWWPTALSVLLELLLYLPMLMERFPWFGRLLAVTSVGSAMVQRPARFGVEKSPGPEEIGDLLFAAHDRAYLSILLFRASTGEDYSPLPSHVFGDHHIEIFCYIHPEMVLLQLTPMTCLRL